MHFDVLGDFLKCSDLVNKFFANGRKNNFCAKPVASFRCNPEDLFSIGQVSVLPVDFLVVFFKSSNRVAEFFGRVRRNDCCAKLVVRTLSIAEDRFSFDRFSVSPAGVFHGFLKSSDLVNEFFGNARRNDFCAKLVVYFGGNPEDRSRSQILVCRSTFLFDPFQELELGRRVS